MKVFINTFGSRGDVQPYIILGMALKNKGHQVMVCTGNRFKEDVTTKGLEYGYITNEAFELLDADKTILEDSIGIFGVLKTSIKLIKKAKPINRKMIVNSWEAANHYEPDVVLYHPKALGAVSIAEKFKIPAILISLVPMLAATTEFPVIGMPKLRLGSWYNRLTYKLITVGYSSYIKDLNDIRISEMGLRKLPKKTGITTTSNGTPVPNIHAISPHVIPRPHDWPAMYTMDGYIAEDKPEEGPPPVELQEFLAAGAPPVYIGFGSMSGSNSKRLTDTVIRALKKANVRGIIASGWGGLRTTDLPETILGIEDAPHAWLFLQVSAVVHHGGAGTTAAGLRAGCPTIICPFMGDQPFWGDQVVRLGVGLKMPSQKKLTVEKLSEAIHTVITDKTIQESAALLGEKLQTEDGTANIICTIESIIAKR